MICINSINTVTKASFIFTSTKCTTCANVPSGCHPLSYIMIVQKLQYTLGLKYNAH